MFLFCSQWWPHENDTYITSIHIVQHIVFIWEALNQTYMFIKQLDLIIDY